MFSPTLSRARQTGAFPYGLPALLSVLVLLSGCSRSTGPSDSSGPLDGGASFDGAFDGAEIVLQRIDAGPGDHARVPVELVGSGIELHPDVEEVSIGVAVRNVSQRVLFAPGIVWIRSFTPPGVSVLNPDIVLNAIDGMPGEYGFDYSDALGEDGALKPGETSGSKRWRFHDPELAPFSFGATAEFALGGDRPRISGRIFVDLNANGVPDAHEPPHPVGTILLRGPEGLEAITNPDRNLGVYRFPIELPGLYRLTYRVPDILDSPLTTPNPLDVLITPGRDGTPMSFGEAHFGVHGSIPPDSIPPVILTDSIGEVEPQDPYRLLGIRVDGRVLVLHVGFSGCSPDHPFELHASSAWMESLPPQTRAVLSHDARGELCLAAFERALLVDLSPLIENYVEAYGEPGPFWIQLVDPDGQVHSVLVEP